MIKEPMVMEIAKNTYAINEFGLSACYFLVGEERALLIDTACGLSDLKGIAASLTDKPYDVPDARPSRSCRRNRCVYGCLSWRGRFCYDTEPERRTAARLC